MIFSYMNLAKRWKSIARHTVWREYTLHITNIMSLSDQDAETALRAVETQCEHDLVEMFGFNCSLGHSAQSNDRTNERPNIQATCIPFLWINAIILMMHTEQCQMHATGSLLSQPNIKTYFKNVYFS